MSVRIAVVAAAFATLVGMDAAHACGMMNQAGSQAPASAGGMCGGGSTAATTPGMSMPQSGPTTQAGGCACCKNMAMMNMKPGANDMQMEMK
jgi:hypothetical protein